MRVSVIVINRNREKLLRRCLESLFRQTFTDFEIVVVDNGSTDGSRDAVRGVVTPCCPLRLVELEGNRGFAAGCNAGIREAQGELIALLNNDAEAEPGWLQALVKAMETSSRVGMCASKILFWGTEVLDKVGHLMYLDGQNRGRGTGELDRGQFDRPEETFFPDGCAALYRRRMLEEVGGFDERFFAYGDDADLGLRGRWLGWKCLYVPEAVVFHHHSATSGRFSPQKVYWIERNRLWLAVKNFPLPLLLLSPFLTLYRWSWNLAGAVLRRGPAGEFGREHSRRLLVRTILRASWDGLRGVGGMWRERRALRRARRISDWDFVRLLFRFRISARTLALKEHPRALPPFSPSLVLPPEPRL